MSSITRRRTWAAAARSRPRSAFSLLELLIAVALILALFAIVSPSLLRLLDDQAFDNAADVTEQQLLLGRALARSSGRPVELVYRVEPRAVQARWFEPDASTAVPEAWADRVLPGTAALSLEPPLDESDPYAAFERSLRPDDAVDGAELFAVADRDAEVRLAIYLPDGSTLVAPTVWLVDDEQRAGRFDINPFTGLPAYERVFGMETEEESEEEEEDKEEEEEQRDEPETVTDPADPVDDASSDRDAPDADDEAPAMDEAPAAQEAPAAVVDEEDVP